MADLATPYLHSMLLALNILCISNPHTPQYKKLKSGMINSLSLKITDRAGKIITNGPGMTVVLHIQ